LSQIFFGTIQDITRKKQMEETLIQSEKMRTIAGLAAGVAHEINTPLSAILQSTQIVEQGLVKDGPQNRELAHEYGIDLAGLHQYCKRMEIDYFLAGIRDSALNASKTVKHLLQFSSPVKDNMTRVNIAELLDNAVELSHSDYDLRKKYNFLNLAIKKEYDPELPAVSCIATEISQVFLNLIKNGAQAMGAESRTDGHNELQPPKKKPLLILRTLRVHDKVRIEVEDNGSGMDNEVRRQLFDPFFTTKEVGEGTGLGLFVSYTIVCDKHRGKLWAESEPGRGTKFVVELPTTVDKLNIHQGMEK